MIEIVGCGRRSDFCLFEQVNARLSHNSRRQCAVARKENIEFHTLFVMKRQGEHMIDRSYERLFI